jgi:hypothetical protein
MSLLRSGVNGVSAMAIRSDVTARRQPPTAAVDDDRGAEWITHHGDPARLMERGAAIFVGDQVLVVEPQEERGAVATGRACCSTEPVIRAIDNLMTTHAIVGYVVERGDGKATRRRVVSVESPPAGMVLTHDQELLIAAAGARVACLDARRLQSGNGNPVLGYWTDGNPRPGRFCVNVTAEPGAPLCMLQNLQTFLRESCQGLFIDSSDGAYLHKRFPGGIQGHAY